MPKVAFLFLLICIPLPVFVGAQCQRDLSGKWDILISPTKAIERVTLTQSGPDLKGTADLHFSGNSPYFGTGGRVTGKAEGDKVQLSIEWSDDRSVITEGFQGTFGPDGRITGQARIWAIAGGVDVDWMSERPMRCLYNPVKKLGTKPSTAQPTATANTSPFIIAAPNNIPLPPGVQVGQSTIVWDGGKDHPYAEIWVKVDNQDERKVVEMGKGTVPVAIEAGRTYVYILTDAGTTLATVTVRFLR